MLQLSPMMEQYFKMKKKAKKSILFFRLGDFYEMFYEDAELVSRELELTLTKKSCGQNEKAPMCGVPYHSSASYISRLVDKGYKVAICDQMEDASKAKGLVKRDITRVITPGTIIEKEMLDESKNNFIASLFASESKIGICFCDISTGELYATEITEDIKMNLEAELSRYSPRELLFTGRKHLLSDLKRFIKDKVSCSLEVQDSESKYEDYEGIVLKHFHAKELDTLKLKSKKELTSCLGELIRYLEHTQKRGLERINKIELYKNSQFMIIDMNTRRNLELVETIIKNRKKGSLLWVLDNTKTAMGKRLLRNWIERPLLNIREIKRRQDAISNLKEDFLYCNEIGDKLSGIFDIERIITKVTYGSATAKDLKSLQWAIRELPNLKAILDKAKATYLKEVYDNVDTLDDIYQLIDESIEDTAANMSETNIIKSGFNKDLDYLRNLMIDAKDIIIKLEEKERNKTGIPTLKIKYNKIFGYFVEVRNNYKDRIPGHYVRKQTLANCERFIFDELKTLEGKILGAKQSAENLEYDLFVGIRNKVAGNLFRIEQTSQAIAKLDVIYSLSYVAIHNKYIRPDVDTSGVIYIKNGRHPVVEQIAGDMSFIANDTNLDLEDNRLHIITGPNMAGKSTYMRQVALICLMAQIGSFIPADEARLGLVDSLFTRVGASDDIASGKSTFMVEMSEVSEILQRATVNSLIVLDEIGRGTATFDGMSIAKAVIEYVLSKSTLGAKTLFATHYHELTSMEHELHGIKNYNTKVKQEGDNITFLRKVVKGAADDSYGIQVAKLSGIPNSIIQRAKVILAELEASSVSTVQTPLFLKSKEKEENQKNEDVPTESKLNDGETLALKKLRKIDVNNLTPLDCMNILLELSETVKKR